MKRVLMIGLVLVLSMGCMTGCGKDTASGGTVTLHMGLPSGADITSQKIVDSFQKEHPEINLVIDEAPWNDFKQKLKLQITSGNAPDVFITDSMYTAVLGANGAALDLTDRVEKDIKTEEYAETLFAARDAQGHLWGVPHGINPLAVYYNQNLFDEAGLPYPTEDWTFEELFETAKKLTKDLDGDGEPDQYGMMSGTNITTGWLPMILATGGAPLDESRTKAMFNDPKTIEGLKKYVEKVWDGFEPSTEWAAAQGGTAAFYMGKIGMYIGLHSNIPVIEKNKADGLRYDVQIIPYGWDGKRHCVYVPNLWVINASAGEAEKEAAWTWIQYYLSEEAQTVMNEEGLDGIQTKLSVLEKMQGLETTPANMQAFSQGLDEYGVTLFENDTIEKWNKEVTDITLRMLNKLTDFDSGVAELQTKVSAILAKEY